MTDRQTARQTDRRTGDGKERAIAYMLSRAKNRETRKFEIVNRETDAARIKTAMLYYIIDVLHEGSQPEKVPIQVR